MCDVQIHKHTKYNTTPKINTKCLTAGWTCGLSSSESAKIQIWLQTSGQSKLFEVQSLYSHFVKIKIPGKHFVLWTLTCEYLFLTSSWQLWPSKERWEVSKCHVVQLRVLFCSTRVPAVLHMHSLSEVKTSCLRRNVSVRTTPLKHPTNHRTEIFTITLPLRCVVESGRPVETSSSLLGNMDSVYFISDRHL